MHGLEVSEERTQLFNSWHDITSLVCTSHHHLLSRGSWSPTNSRKEFEGGKCDGIRARGGMWNLQGERTSDAHARGASRPNSLLCLARTGRHLLLATLRCPPAFDSKGQCEARQEPWLTEPALAALAASVCCAPLCGSGALIARMLDKQRGEQPSVGAREDGTELDAPVPVLPIPHCTALRWTARISTRASLSLNAPLHSAVAIPGRPSPSRGGWGACAFRNLYYVSHKVTLWLFF